MRVTILALLLIGCGGVNGSGLGDVKPDAGTDASADPDTGTPPDAGTPGRANGAGCAADDQCASGICTTPASGSAKMCCDKRAADSCSACVGGFLAPVADGTTCGASTCDTTQTRHTLTCVSGTCTDTTIDCTMAMCDTTTNLSVCATGTGKCDPSGSDLPCYCYDPGGMGHVSKPCGS